MSDECLGISLLLEKSAAKKYSYKNKDMEELIQYVGQVEEFLELLETQLSRNPSIELQNRAAELEESIDKSQKRLQRIGRKRIEAGANVKAELIYIELVRRIEKLGDYCFEISGPEREPRKLSS